MQQETGWVFFCEGEKPKCFVTQKEKEKKQKGQTKKPHLEKKKKKKKNPAETFQ